MPATPTARPNARDGCTAHLLDWWIPVIVITAWLAVGFAIVWLGIDFSSPGTAFVAFGVVSAPVVYWLMWREDFDGIASTWRYRQALKSRKPLSPQEFYDEFYRDSGIDEGLVRRFLDLTAEFWIVDRPMIRPEDNYCAMNGHELDEELIEKLRMEFAVELIDEDRQTIDGSVDSIIRWLEATARPKSAM